MRPTASKLTKVKMYIPVSLLVLGKISLAKMIQPKTLPKCTMPISRESAFDLPKVIPY